MIWSKRWMLRSIVSTIRFNFHYLPFSQAIYLPIGLYKCNLLKLDGKILIDTDEPLRPGMIRLGCYGVSIFPNFGLIYENHGGLIVFKGSCNIGNISAISIGEKGEIIFGKKFEATTTFKLVCYNKVYFSDNVSFGWDCIVMDTDFHRMKKVGGGFSKGFGTIQIGKGNWFANRCTILKNTETSDYCTFSSSSVVSGKFDIPYSVYSPQSIELKVKGVYRDRTDDTINYGR